MPFTVNNIILKCKIKKTKVINRYSGEKQLVFFDNKFKISGREFSIRITNNIFHIFCFEKIGIYQHLRNFLISKLFLEKTAKLFIKIVNFQASVTSQKKTKDLAQFLLPHLDKYYKILRSEAEQDGTVASPLPLSDILQEADNLKAFNLRLGKIPATIKFQSSKTKNETHISIILPTFSSTIGEFLEHLEKCLK